MVRVLVAALGASALIAGCAAPLSADYVPPVDTQGVDADVLATDVAVCRDVASQVRVMRLKGERDDVTDAVIIGVGLFVPFGLVGMALISTISAAVETGLPETQPADARLQQKTLINCMARKGYRNLDPEVTVSYIAPRPLPATIAAGRDAFVAERHAEARLCPQGTARALLDSKGPGFERYRVACDNGTRVILRCEFGSCTQESASLDVALTTQ
jgi:hypothetical protein